ncbi:MAG: YtxH domain-containing protein [Paenibacillaceae bacterium]
MSDNNMNGKDFLLGAVVGGIIGAITALLVAPKPGEELRADIKDTVNTVNTRTQELASQVSDRSQTIAKNVSERSQVIAKNVGIHTSELVEKAKELAGTVVTEVKGWKEARNEVKSANTTTADEETDTYK